VVEKKIRENAATSRTKTAQRYAYTYRLQKGLVQGVRGQSRRGLSENLLAGNDSAT